MENKSKQPNEMTNYGRNYEKRLETMSPFEIKNNLIEYAKDVSKNTSATFLNAGRGNPNWITTIPRQAFFMIGMFGIEDCKNNSHFDSDKIAPIPQKEGIADRFISYLGDCDVSKFLRKAYTYAIKLGICGDDLIYEWVSGIIGDQYPGPDRILKNTEIIVNNYLNKELLQYLDYTADLQLFATEGGTAAMCYLFNSLKANKLIKHGDHVAIMTPIFTPYIEIPNLDEFGFKVSEIKATKMTKDNFHTWQYPDNELDKLKDASIKVLCVVNPSNPPSYAMDTHTLHRIAKIVHDDNPNLMIITDDVYGTFVPEFKSLMAQLPYNTACVYSFSKYFGCTGWRLAVIALTQNNIFDNTISNLPVEESKELHNRYKSISLCPDKLKFIDRLVADSRLVALNHTAGLSTPQQIQMSLFALFTLIDTDNSYKCDMQLLIKRRLEAMWENTGFTLVDDKLRAGYYSEIDILLWAQKLYGDEFAKWLEENFEPIDFVIRLAKETGIVLLNGGGFDGPQWSVRASLANLDEEEYAKIGTHIGKMLGEYASKWYPDN